MQTQEDLVQPFLDRVFVSSHSQNTVKAYRLGINHFTKFVDGNYHCSDLEILTKFKEARLDVYRVLGDFVIHLDKLGRKPKTVKLCVTAVKEYLRYHGIKIYSEDFRQFVKLPKKVIIREEPLTKQILVRLLHSLPIKLQALVLVAIASGMRIGELVQLRLSDIDFESRPTRILVRAETSKSKVGRETYLTAEATRILKDYLARAFGYKENGSNESIKNIVIFAPIGIKKDEKEYKMDSVYRAKHVLYDSLYCHIGKIPELSKLNENGRKVIHFHAFRKYFRTVVGNAVGRDYAEALMGHSFYLDTYYNLPQDERREMYLKAEPGLTISDYAKIEKDINKVVSKYKEIEEFLNLHFLDYPKILEERSRR